MVTITGNFQMSNSKATCIDLMEWYHLFDTYCYDPNNTTSPASTGSILTDEMLSVLSWITIVDIIYNPEWSDTDRESLTIDSGSGFVYLSGKVYLRFHDTTKMMMYNTLHNLIGFSITADCSLIGFYLIQQVKISNIRMNNLRFLGVLKIDRSWQSMSKSW